MNKETLSKIKMKCKAYYRYLKTKNRHDYQMYAKYRKQSKNGCRKAVADYQKFLSRKVKSNLKVFVRYAKNNLSFKTLIPDLADNGKIISDDTGKAKTFSMFFKSVLQSNQIVFQVLVRMSNLISYTYFFPGRKNRYNLNSYKLPGADKFHSRKLKEICN